ncbi:hypothetical protein [Actinomadura rupiterrae]|uniref:hypothetical protein n=1 Tax=Actinomadura rupiterrae TaxID=559627 RepID=UPI0020A4F680|nr:hypothetical protein [Actinomadura rupiterrae]MCP2341024.1 hypothetical protein [Actinomadura rupiterrae]
MNDNGSEPVNAAAVAWLEDPQGGFFRTIGGCVEQPMITLKDDLDFGVWAYLDDCDEEP